MQFEHSICNLASSNTKHKNTVFIQILLSRLVLIFVRCICTSRLVCYCSRHCQEKDEDDHGLECQALGQVSKWWPVNYIADKWVDNHADPIPQAGTTAALLPDQLRLVIRIWLKVMITIFSIYYDDDDADVGFDDHVIHAVGLFISVLGIGCVYAWCCRSF